MQVGDSARDYPLLKGAAMAILGTVVAVPATIGTILNGNIAQQIFNVLLLNIDATGTAYFGGSNVGTVSTGFRLLPGASLALTMRPTDILFGIGTQGAGGTVQVSVLAQGVAPQ